MPIFESGIKLLLVASQTPLEVNPGFPVDYLHFKDGNGATIIPTYERDGLRTSVGPFSGAAITVASAADIVAINDRATTLEAGGRWAASVAAVPESAPYSLTLTVGTLHRLNLENFGDLDEATITLPAASADNVGRRIGLSVISAGQIGPSNKILEITTTGGQALEGRTLPFAPAGYRPRFVFVSVPIVTDTTWGWSLESYTVDSTA